jgi:hypothetical protein
MKVRILTSIAGEWWSLRPGQVIDVPTLTQEIRAWLVPGTDGTARAELVREDETEVAAVATGEKAVVKRGRAR